MIYKYFYDIDDIGLEWNTELGYFLETMKQTLWNIGTALWYIEDENNNT